MSDINGEILGNFDQLDQLNKTNSAEERTNWTLNRMDKGIEATIRVLDSFNTPGQLSCLEAFLQAYELVSWLRKNTKDLKEFKFLVDLILTARSNDHGQLSAATKAAFAITLKDACVGYASLIYELRPETDGFERLVQLCETLWLNWQADAKIGDKLMAVKGESSLLEKIKEKKSNAEMSCIEQAKQINANGVYKITRGSSGLESWVTLETEFIKPAAEGSEKETKRFGFDELNELKSMIMLVAKRTATTDAQDDENSTLEYFIEVFDYVHRLADTFLKLVNKGAIASSIPLNNPTKT